MPFRTPSRLIERHLPYCGVLVVGSVLTALVLLSVDGVRRANRPRQQAADMLERMKTVCVGRLLIEVPAEMETRLQGAFLDGFDISVSAEEEHSFATRLEKRERELANPDPLPGAFLKPLELAKPFKVGDFSGTLLVAERETSYWFESGRKVNSTTVRVEAFARAQGYTVNLTSRFVDPEHIERPLKILRQLQINPGNAQPEESGFCIDHAYLREPLAANQQERVTLLAGLPAHTDFALMFSSTVGAEIPEDNLLARTSKARTTRSPRERMRIQSLGDGERSINGFPGQESLTRYREMTHTTGYGLVWESQAIANDVLRPALYLEMQTGANPSPGGGPVDSSIPEADMLRLWNRISSSVRIRPVVAAKNTAARVVKPVIGDYASTGDACPHSGWWHCSDDGYGMAIRDGRRRYFNEGDLLPQAIVLIPQTIWDRLRRRQLTHQSQHPTVWKLVELPVEPKAPET